MNCFQVPLKRSFPEPVVLNQPPVVAYLVRGICKAPQYTQQDMIPHLEKTVFAMNVLVKTSQLSFSLQLLCGFPAKQIAQIKLEHKRLCFLGNFQKEKKVWCMQKERQKEREREQELERSPHHQSPHFVGFLP